MHRSDPVLEDHLLKVPFCANGHSLLIKVWASLTLIHCNPLEPVLGNKISQDVLNKYQNMLDLQCLIIIFFVEISMHAKLSAPH